MEYKVISYIDEELFNGRVTYHMSKGWRPQGGVCVLEKDYSYTYYQAMVRDESDIPESGDSDDEGEDD